MHKPASKQEGIRDLEAQLEESLFAVDFAEKRREPTFGPRARVAEIQDRLEQLRGPVAEHLERRAAWLAHLARSEECQAVRDGPAAAEFPPRRRQASPTKLFTGAIEFPRID